MASIFSKVLAVTQLQAPELIVPARPTPREVKQLSDIDDQESFRFHVPLIFIYKNNNNDPSSLGKDPVKVIKEAISKALVYYYPLAGRLREGPNRKLSVDCNGEGILFLEAEANFKLDQLGDPIQPPFPYLEQLLFNVPGSDGIIGGPMLFIQVTRFISGGFTLAIRFNHTVGDAIGLQQFLNTIEDMARGSDNPSPFPIWERERLRARDPPQITCTHLEYDEINNESDTFITTNPNDMDHKSFYFGPKEIQKLRDQLPCTSTTTTTTTTFDLLAALMWRCRTIALQLDPNDTVQISCLVNARSNDCKINIPSGYYGNAVTFPAVRSRVDALCKNGLSYAVALVRKAKAEMSDEYMRSAADLLVVKGRLPVYPVKGNYIVSDISKIGFDRLDLGWGKPVFGGVAGAVSLISFFLRYQKEDGETGIHIPICLPRLNMKRFEDELKRMIQGYSTEDLSDMILKTQHKTACSKL